MKLFANYHVYRRGPDGLPKTVNIQSSDADRSSEPTGTPASEGRTAEPDRELNARRSRIDRMKFFTLTKGKYRPAAPAAPAALPALPDWQNEPTLSAMISSVIPSFSEPFTERIVPLSMRPPKPFHFTKLPLELQLLIVRHLDSGDIKRFRGVSKFASSLGATALHHLRIDDPGSLKTALELFMESGIKSLTISDKFRKNHLLNSEMQRLMRSALGKLKVFDMSDCEDLSPVQIMDAVVRMPALEELKLSAKTVSKMVRMHLDQGLDENMLRPLAYLKQLELTRFDAPLSDLLPYVERLTHLKLEKIDGLTDAALLDALGRLPNLTHLRLKNCIQITPAGVANALAQANNLTSFELDETDEMEETLNTINDEELNNLLAQTPQLTHLALSNCLEFSSAGLVDALHHVSNNIISLSLINNEQLNATGVATILQQVPSLQKLDLSGISELTDAQLAAALQQVPHLKELKMQYFGLITDEGLAAALEHVPELTHLDVTTCDDLQHVRFPLLRSLETLIAGECAGLHSITLDNLPSLRNLDISDNAALDKEAMKNSLQDVRNTLVMLDMSSLNLYDQEMPDLSGFAKLRRLDLSDNRQITDTVLRSLPVLDYLKVTGCHDLTDKALAAVNANKIAQYYDDAPSHK